MPEYACKQKGCPFWGTYNEICNNCNDLKEATLKSDEKVTTKPIIEPTCHCPHYLICPQSDIDKQKQTIDKAIQEIIMECPACGWEGPDTECKNEKCPACGVNLNTDNKKKYTCCYGVKIPTPYCPSQISCMDSNKGGTCPT